jgi:hypothetical protein
MCPVQEPGTALHTLHLTTSAVPGLRPLPGGIEQLKVQLGPYPHQCRLLVALDTVWLIRLCIGLMGSGGPDACDQLRKIVFVKRDCEGPAGILADCTFCML